MDARHARAGGEGGILYLLLLIAGAYVPLSARQVTTLQFNKEIYENMLFSLLQ